MLRTTMTVTAAALATVAGLAACGPARMGSAAIVGDHSITTATLTSEVANLESAYKASQGRIRLQFAESQTTQQVLSWLVRFQIRERMAARNHITVTNAEVQQAISTTTSQAKASGSASLADLAVANGLPPDMIRELGRYQAIETVLVQRLDGGTLPTSQTGLQALSKKLNHSQCLAAKSLTIKINPQFGRMDYSQLSIIPAAQTLSAPQGGIPSPSTAPQVTPAC